MQVVKPRSFKTTAQRLIDAGYDVPPMDLRDLEALTLLSGPFNSIEVS
jgi:hypothetical protein